MSHAEAHGHHDHGHHEHHHHAHHGHDHGHAAHGHHDDHHDEKPHGFLNTVFDSTMGGFGIVWVCGLLVCIFLLMLLG